jgi:hypothetical protein
MKVAKLSSLKSMLNKEFTQRLEGVDRVRRGEDTAGDYHDENEGAGVSYEEDVDRLRRAADGYGETEFEESVEENLEETNLYSDADKKGAEEEDEEAKSHAQPSGAEDFYAAALGEGKLPSLTQVFSEGTLTGLDHFKSRRSK